MTPSIFAHFDGETIVLDEPFELKPNMKLIVTILSEETDERDEWIVSAKKNLARAYEDDEPEYDLSLIKERNPDYAGK